MRKPCERPWYSSRDEEMAQTKREAAEARLAKWVEVEEEKQRTRDQLRQKRLEEETDQLNRQLQAAAYRGWEAWVVLNTPPTHGAWTRSGYTLLEASVLQNGRPVAKKARWSVPLRGEGSFVVQFEIGPVGQQADATVPRGSHASGPPNDRAQPLPGSDTAVDTHPRIPAPGRNS